MEFSQHDGISILKNMAGAAAFRVLDTDLRSLFASSESMSAVRSGTEKYSLLQNANSLALIFFSVIKAAAREGDFSASFLMREMCMDKILASICAKKTTVKHFIIEKNGSNKATKKVDGTPAVSRAISSVNARQSSHAEVVSRFSDVWVISARTLKWGC